MVYNYVRRYSSRQSRDNIGYEQPSTVVRSYTTTSTRILVHDERKHTAILCSQKREIEDCWILFVYDTTANVPDFESLCV